MTVAGLRVFQSMNFFMLILPIKPKPLDPMKLTEIMLNKCLLFLLSLIACAYSLKHC